MATIPAPAPEDAIFRDEVYRLETTDPVLGHTGGDNGVSNEQATQLIENDVFLKKKVDDLAAGTGLGDNTIERIKLKRGVLPAGVPRNTVISGPYTDSVRTLLVPSGSAMVFGAFRVAFAKGYDAKGQLDYFASVSAGVAQSASAEGVYYFFARMTEDTGLVDVRHTTLAPVFSTTAPSSPANFQRWYDQNNEVMKYWDSATSAWIETLGVFIGQARRLSIGVWNDVITYEYRRDTNLENGSIPAGTIVPFASNSVPTGWVLCDGQERSISEYPRLYAVIGTNYGGDSEAGYFQVPDLRGRIPVGRDNMSDLSAGRITGAWADTLGGFAGQEDVTLTINQMPAHGHPYRSGVAAVSSADGDGGFVRDSNMATTITAHNGSATATDGQQIGGSGAGQAHNNVQPSLAVNYIIKA